MTYRDKYDLKIKRLVAIETGYRHALHQAEDDLRRDATHRPRHIRRIAKYKRKIEKLLPKLRRQRELRTALR